MAIVPALYQHVARVRSGKRGRFLIRWHADMEGLSSNRSDTGLLLARNIAYRTSATLLINACVFGSNWALIALYGATEHGRIVRIVAMVHMGVLLADMGLGNKAGVRMIARLRASAPEHLSKTISDLMAILLVAGALAAVGIIVFASPRPGIDKMTLCLAGTWVFAATVAGACRMVVIGFERMGNVLIMGPSAAAGKLLWIAACGIWNLPVAWVFVGWTAAHLLAMLIAIWRLRVLARQVGLRIRAGLRGLRRAPRIVGGALPYYVPVLGLLGLPFVTQLAIGSIRPDNVAAAEVSIFQVCFALAMVSRLLAMPISSVLFPRAAHADASSDADHQQTAAVVKQAARLLGLVGTAVFALHWAIGPDVMGLLYGSRYANALPTLLVLAVAIGIDNYSIQLDQVLMATRSVGVVARLEALRYALLAGIWWWSIPTYGPLGAAAAIAVTAAVAVVCKIIATRRHISGIGALSFASTLGTFALTAGAGLLLPNNRYLVLPAWLVAALVLRLLRPREIAGWAQALLGAFAAGKQTDRT